MKFDIINILTNNLYIVIYIGAISVHMFSVYKGSFTGVQIKLRELFPNWKNETYSRIDTIITPLLGTALAFFLLHPIDLQSAILNGITWNIAFMSILKKEKNG